MVIGRSFSQVFFLLHKKLAIWLEFYCITSVGIWFCCVAILISKLLSSFRIYSNKTVKTEIFQFKIYYFRVINTLDHPLTLWFSYLNATWICQLLQRMDNHFYRYLQQDICLNYELFLQEISWKCSICQGQTIFQGTCFIWALVSGRPLQFPALCT